MTLPRTRKTREAGSALIAVLFVIVMLSVLVGSFIFEAQLEAKYARYAKNRLKSKYLAESGIVLAEMLMSKQGRSGGIEKTDEEDKWHDAAERLRRGQPIQGLIQPLGEGYIILDIVPEPGKMNINLLTEDEWETILGNIGVPEEYWQDIIEPVLDWIDTDETARTKGAETDDYYSLLDPPYKAKNGPVDTVRELLLVKGFSESILTGGLFDPETLEDSPGSYAKFRRAVRANETNQIYIAGIESMMTTYGDGKINIQSAPYDVLRTLPDVDDILARAIMEEREALDDNDEPDPFTSIDDLFTRIDGLSAAVGDRITVNSQYYRITSTGRIGDVERQLWCIAYYDAGTLRILRWCEEP